MQQLPSNARSQGLNALQVNAYSTKLQQQIKTLQNQITTQQQLYMKTANPASGNTIDHLRSPNAVNDPLQQLTNAFSNASIDKPVS